MFQVKLIRTNAYYNDDYENYNPIKEEIITNVVCI